MQVTGSKSTYSNLSIRVIADGFSFLVTEGHSGDILLCQDYTASDPSQLYAMLYEKFRSEELSAFRFSRVRVITNSDATCIPQQEFVTEQLNAVYSTVFPPFDEALYEVSYTHLPQLDIVVAFTIPSALRQTVQSAYPDATFTNAFAVVLGRIATYCKRQNLPDDSLFAYVTPLQLFLYSIKGDELQFANSFPLSQPKDSLFYLLSVWKVLGFNARSQHCYLAGEEGSVEYLSQALAAYLQHVDVMPVSLEG